MKISLRFLWTHWVVGVWYINYAPTYKALCFAPLPMITVLISWGKDPKDFFKTMKVTRV